MLHGQRPCPAPLIEAGEDGPRHGYRFRWPSLPVADVKNTEFWEPAALGKGASHVRSCIVMA